MDKPGFGIAPQKLWARIIGFTALIAFLAFLFHPEGYVVSRLVAHAPADIGSFLKLVFGFVGEIAFAILVWLLIKVEKPKDTRSFLKIGPPDVWGMFLSQYLPGHLYSRVMGNRALHCRYLGIE